MRSRIYSRESSASLFRTKARPPEEFLRNVLAAGAEPEYMKCVFDSYALLTAGEDLRAGEIFDNFRAITGRNPKTLADFPKTRQKQLRSPRMNELWEAE